MPQFIKDMEMTWNVAFSKGSCFDPNYGVNGIPHVAIIDAKGVVRFRGIHPGSKLPEMMDNIDSLLKEANLAVPSREAKSESNETVPSNPMK